MMQAGQDAVSAYFEDFRHLGDSLPGHRTGWVRDLRHQAMDQFMALGFPGAGNEAWKYTDVGPLARRRFRPAAAASPVAPDALAGLSLAQDSAFRLVFVDGHFAPGLSATGRLPRGLTMANMASVLDDKPALAEGLLARLADGKENPFTALNMALATDGAFVRLDRNMTVEEPIHLVFLAAAGDDSASHVRNVVFAETGSSATVVETYISLRDGRYFTNAVTEVITEPNASVDHYKLELESEQAYHIGALHVSLDRDSRYISNNVAVGGRLTRNEVSAILDAPGSDCTLNGLYITRGRQHVDNHTRVDHRKPHGSSREWYKGVLDGHSRSVFSGRVVVHPDAQKTDAQQANNNLLLSEGAEADSQPQLEIYADDVKCSHGSTVGHLDEDALFYLRSRCVDETLARNILVYAFASDILQRMQLAPVRQELERQLTGRLLHGRSVEELTL